VAIDNNSEFNLLNDDFTIRTPFESMSGGFPTFHNNASLNGVSQPDQDIDLEAAISGQDSVKLGAKCPNWITGWV
jgi:hypothetical protein